MKNQGISAIRAIATCMIVSCHILQGLESELAVWMNVGVQIFLCMSGYLYGRKHIENVSQWYKKQYLKIMKPVWVLLTVIIIVGVFVTKQFPSIMSVGKSYLGLAAFDTIPTLSHTWFVTYIILCYLITPLLQGIRIETEEKNWKFVVKLGILVVVLEALYVTQIISAMPQYLVCYIVGYYLSKREVFCKNKKADRQLVILIAVVTVITLPIRLFVQYGTLIVGVPSWDMIRTQITDWHHSLLGITLFFAGVYLFEKLQVKENKMLRFFDKYSYCIYLVHQVFILGTFSLLHVTEYLVLNLVMILVVVCFAGVILKKVVRD